MSWDPKITTPPGLYIVTMFLWRVGRLLGFTLDAHPVAQARVTNLLGILLLPWICAVAQTSTPSLLRWRIAYVCTALPPLWFFGFLYYTDVWSVCSILAAAAAAVRRQHALASLVCFIPTLQYTDVSAVRHCITFFPAEQHRLDPVRGRGDCAGQFGAAHPAAAGLTSLTAHALPTRCTTGCPARHSGVSRADPWLCGLPHVEPGQCRAGRP